MVESSQIATWANAVTVGRLLLSPLMFWVIPNHQRGSWIAFVLWLIFCLSDGIDGYIARRHGVTSAGAFLDPLADKVLVLGAMFTLVSIGVFWVVPVIIIAARELIISVYRVIVGGRGISVPASKLGKYKTVCQQMAVGFALLPADRARRELAVERLPVGRGRARRGQRCAVPLDGPPDASDRRGDAGGRPGRLSESRTESDPTRHDRGGHCAVTWSPSVPSCCSGQIIDSNSAWIGGELAAHGIDSLVQVKVGDNVGAHHRAAAPGARRCRRRHHVWRARADPRRPDPRRDRRRDGCRPRPRRGGGRRDPRDVRRPRAGRCRTTTCARPTCPSGRDDHPADAGHGTRAHLSGRSSTASTRSSTRCPACRTRCTT